MVLFNFFHLPGVKDSRPERETQPPAEAASPLGIFQALKGRFQGSPTPCPTYGLKKGLPSPACNIWLEATTRLVRGKARASLGSFNKRKYPCLLRRRLRQVDASPPRAQGASYVKGENLPPGKVLQQRQVRRFMEFRLSKRDSRRHNGCAKALPAGFYVSSALHHSTYRR